MYTVLRCKEPLLWSHPAFNVQHHVHVYLNVPSCTVTPTTTTPTFWPFDDDAQMHVYAYNIQNSTEHAQRVRTLCESNLFFQLHLG